LEQEGTPVTPGHYESEVRAHAADVGVELGKHLDVAYEAGYEVEQVLVLVSYRKPDGEIVAWRSLHPARTTSSVGLVKTALRKLNAALD
jgi:hypothetical protein